MDYFAEIRFGLIFTQLRFEVEFEPVGMKGPDLGVCRDKQSAYAEVRRFRPGRSAIAGNRDELIPYGNRRKTSKRFLTKYLRNSASLIVAKELWPFGVTTMI